MIIGSMLFTMKIKERGGDTYLKLYEKFYSLSLWFRYQSTYLEMKYHLRQVLKGREDSYFKNIYHYDRNIGKSAALARLSAKYSIPVVVPGWSWKKLVERDIPAYLPKYFKRKHPTTIVMNEICESEIYDGLLVEECLDRECLAKVSLMAKHLVGYRNYD